MTNKPLTFTVGESVMDKNNDIWEIDQITKNPYDHTCEDGITISNVLYICKHSSGRYEVFHEEGIRKIV